MPILTATFIHTFRLRLIEWFRAYGRDLPWRHTTDPYHIWVSEIILQQTQVKQGLDYYLRFISTFPDVRSLSEADDSTLLHVWQGLGYYSRAHNMKHAARQIIEEHDGNFPDDPRDIARLKGIGPYTTAAISSIAFGLPLAVVDGNVYRVLSRTLGDDTPIDTTEGKKRYFALASELLDPKEPSTYNQAIMDFGALVCTPKNPECDTCPIRDLCISKGSELVEFLPRKARRTEIKEEYLDFYLLQKADSIAVEKRDHSGIWKGLYQFLLRTTVPEGWREIEVLTLPDHRLTHRLLHIRVHLCEETGERMSTTTLSRTDGIDIESIGEGLRFIPIDHHPDYAFPKPLRQFLDQHYPRGER